MTCPDWRHLDPDAESAAWEAALRHLDGGCRHCWPEALAADPTLIFKRLPQATLAAAAEEDEVAATRLAVAAMRNASRSSNRSRLAARVALPDRDSFHGAKRWALAAGLAAVALLVGADHAWRDGALGGLHGARGVAALRMRAGVSTPSLPAGGATPAMIRPAGSAGGPAEAYPAADRSSIEGLSRPGARVYQLDGPQMSVVMIVDEKLDV